jgi:predicted MFS family arabinose efflux permease
VLTDLRSLPSAAKRAAFLGAFIVFLTLGTRSGFGLWLKPVTGDLGIGRETFGLAIALEDLILGLPFVAMLADKLEPRRVVMASGLLFSIGLIVAGVFASPVGLFVSFAPLIGVALSGTSFAVVLGAVGRVVPEDRRGAVFGMITAAASLGIFVVVPISQALLETFGWRMAFGLIGLGMVLVVVAGALLPRGSAAAPEEMAPISMLKTIERARKNPNYLLLVAGFFVCGFHVSFIRTHLSPFLEDGGIDARFGAAALALIGLFNIFGSVTFGTLGDRYRKRTLLSMLYFGRAVVISLFLFFPLTSTTALVFAGSIGFLWLATVPLTSGIVAQIFGPRYLGTLFGIVFMSHQVGAFLGAWLGGRVFDRYGSYDAVWIAAVILGVIAGLLHLPIKDRPDQSLVGEVAPAPA